jgi:uncharacterized coiled-coil DUF342 family protein
MHGRQALRRIAFTLVPKVGALYNYMQQLRDERDRLAAQAAFAFDDKREALADRNGLAKQLAASEQIQDELRAELRNLRDAWRAALDEKDGLLGQIESQQKERDMVVETLEQTKRALSEVENSRNVLQAQVRTMQVEREALRSILAVEYEKSIRFQLVQGNNKKPANAGD